MNRQWAVEGERSNPLALWSITWLARSLGRGVSRLLLYPIVGYFLFTLRQVRGHSRHYLTRVLARPATLADVARHLHCFASTLLDRVFLLTGHHELLAVTIHNDELLLDRVRAGRGCLLLGSHLGSFEVMRCLARQRPELRVRIMMRRAQNPMITAVVESLNPEMAAAVIDIDQQSTATFLQAKEALDAGECVALLGDRVQGDGRQTRCRFLGTDAVFPTSPYLLASMLRVPLILCFGLYRGGNRYDIYFEELADDLRIDRRARHTELQRWAQQYASRLEHYTRDAPYNWFNFYDFWQVPDDA